MHPIYGRIMLAFQGMKTQELYKYVGILLLTLQQASMPLMVRSTRYREESQVFITTVNVFFMEVIKITLCSSILIAKERSVSMFLESVRSALFDDYVETLKILVPAVIYLLQNNLYYIALTNLEATTFCVTYQLKIMTTALMLYFILGKQLSRNQWIALLLLIIGVSDVQMQYEPPKPTAGFVEQSPLLGLTAVVTMCFTSAFAGVYMEKVLKQSTHNVWMQNIRLASFGLVMAAASMFYKDSEAIREYGLFKGFDSLVWLMTLTNSTGGLLISVVIKYADNILKGYAQSTAIIGAALGSWLIFDFVPNFFFVLGTGFVIASIVLYTKYPYRETNQKGLPVRS